MKNAHIPLQFRSGRRLPARVRLPQPPSQKSSVLRGLPGSPAQGARLCLWHIRMCAWGPPRHMALMLYLDLDIVCLNQRRLS